jgi:ABC-type multidrug transport system fused ATPase/permease subunit
MTYSFAYSFPVHDLSPFQPNTTLAITGAPSEHLRYYLGIYVALSIGTIFIGLFRYFFIYTGSIRASRRMFDSLSFTILRTPLRWMDTVPLGRILNRFTADFNIVDSRLANDVGFGANNLFRLIGVIVAG